MATEINELTDLAYEGSGLPLTTSPVVGTPSRPYADLFVPGAEDVAPDEMRVKIDPYRWPVIGASTEHSPPMNPPLEPPAWWVDALITD